MEAGLDEVLQHLVLAALAVNMEQVQIPNSSCHIVKGSGGVDDLQGNLLSFLRLVVFHSKGSLAFKVSLGQQNCPSSVTQSVFIKLNIPLVSFKVAAPNFLQVFVKSRNWLVDVQLTEMLF